MVLKLGSSSWAGHLLESGVPHTWKEHKKRTVEAMYVCNRSQSLENSGELHPHLSVALHKEEADEKKYTPVNHSRGVPNA